MRRSGHTGACRSQGGGVTHRRGVGTYRCMQARGGSVEWGGARACGAVWGPDMSAGRGLGVPVGRGLGMPAEPRHVVTEALRHVERSGSCMSWDCANWRVSARRHLPRHGKSAGTRSCESLTALWAAVGAARGGAAR
eukprot:358810-Chlamydomonas_euryale.AAC.5